MILNEALGAFDGEGGAAVHSAALTPHQEGDILGRGMGGWEEGGFFLGAARRRGEQRDGGEKGGKARYSGTYRSSFLLRPSPLSKQGNRT